MKPAPAPTLRGLSALLCLLAACSTGPAFPDDGAPIVYDVAPLELDPYRIGPGDTLAIRYAYQPERNTDVVVRPDGKISIPLAEEVHAAGKSAAELDDELTKIMGKHLKNPDLSVMVTLFAAQRVFVGGEVNQPGQVDLQPGLTALGALSSRGWLKASAASDSLLLIRAAGPGKRLVKRLDLSKENVAKNDIALRPYDILFAPKSSVSQVGEWVEQNINAIIPRAISFGAFYDVNTLNLK